MLTEDYKSNRVEASREFLNQHANTKAFLASTLTGDFITSHLSQNSNRSSGDTLTLQKKKDFKVTQPVGEIMARDF